MNTFTAKKNISPFEQARIDADNFCHNLFLSYTINECAIKLQQIEQEYEAAILRDDKKMIGQKKLEIQTYKSSITITALILDEVDEIST